MSSRAVDKVAQKVIGQTQSGPAPLTAETFQNMAAQLRQEVLHEVKEHLDGTACELGARVMSVEGQVAAVAQRVDGQEAMLRTMFQEQMSRIEELMAPKRARQVVGSHTGVGFMSSFPLRAAPHSWPDEVWNTSRAQISSVLLRSVWLLAAVVYGFASQPASTVALLEEVTQRVVLEADGPRLIAGDFNLEIDKIPCSGLWRERGFMEIQDLFQQLSGVAPRVTCKASTRKDFVFVSSELQDMLRNVVVDSTFFPDHAVLYGAFQFPGLPEPRTYWRVPVARPAKELQGLRLRQGRVPTTQDMDPTSAFQAICEEYENRKRQRLRKLGGYRPWFKAGVVAEAVFTSFQANLHAFEKHLLNVRSREAAERRRNAPALIFKDLTDPPVAPVVTLLERTKAKVVEVQPDDAAVVLEREVEWPHSPFVGPRGPVDVHHAEADMLWGDLDDLHVGDEVSQSVVVGSLTDLFKAFGEAWQRRWCRHDVVEPERWQNAVASAQRLARNGSMDLPPTTPELWRATLRSKSARSSTGLDGLSRLDLALMPDDLLQLVLELCSRAEETGLWPRQAVLGVVTALEKRVNSEGVNDYRPITVLSVLYRTWSSIRARQALQYVASFAPPRMYGNMNGRTAGQLWYSVQLAIESSNLRRAPMLGFIADLEKAFNLLPRTPVFALARAVGIAEPIIRGWCGAMVALERRFRIRQSIGPAIRSSTGFPEGCGLSCLAMALVDLALHAHVSDSVLGATLATCVDNWEGHAPDAPTLLLAHRAMEDFTSAWDLKLDVSKTVCWGTTAAARRQLRAAGMKVCLDCRDLGGHLQFSQRRTNYTLTSRLDSLTPLWSRLRASFASTEQKVRALSVSAWPRGLHGVSGVSLGRQHICNLRSGAMYGLAWDRPGANPLLHLSLISYPTSDPEFYAIRQTVLDLRQYTDRHEAAPLITEVVACPGRRPPGPIGVLLERVAMLNWTWDATAETFYDVLCPFCLWDVAIQELELHLVIGWQQHVASLVQERPRFGGLVDVDPLLTRELCKERPGPEQALLQVALGGSFFTEDKLCHFEDLQDDDDAVAEWLLTNNPDVDTAARAANLLRGKSFWQLWEEVRKDLAYQTFVGRAVLKVHGAIGVVASRRDESRFQAVERDFQPRPEQAITLGDVSADANGVFSRRYGARYQRELRAWLSQFVRHAPHQQASLRWISILQLLCSFVLETGRRPPFFDSASRTWYEPDDRVRGHLITVEARKLTTWFGRSLRAFVTATGGNYHSEDIRPDSAALQIKLRSIPCQLEPCAYQRVEQLLARSLPGEVCSGRSTAWASIRF
ncbi:hypothetical protein AK812_SmicGene22690 [Symbiodinium microadriaticum]|uniref:Uncharacterized protein n=1 Tax=Symbiodinium microadriaticum TaxID=2951 RepID=A0A1Q9DJ42_SYMMI|nr:hypothetical protein AK812_SmicGene22690 [Symbiodinium microadriaticum]CAE6934152.1 unnamed protein product [Symbiodinium sp. KB8]